MGVQAGRIQGEVIGRKMDDATPEGKRNFGAWLARCRTDQSMWTDDLYEWVVAYCDAERDRIFVNLTDIQQAQFVSQLTSEGKKVTDENVKKLLRVSFDLTQSMAVEYIADRTGYSFLLDPESSWARWWGDMERWAGSPKLKHRGRPRTPILDGLVKTKFLSLPKPVGDFQAGPVDDLSAIVLTLAGIINPMEAFQ